MSAITARNKYWAMFAGRYFRYVRIIAIRTNMFFGCFGFAKLHLMSTLERVGFVSDRGSLASGISRAVKRVCVGLSFLVVAVC